MAQLRKFQFLRNSTISSYANYALARTAAEAAFGGITTLQDGEIALYSYKLNGDATKVHTLLGIKRTNGIEIVANYDELTAEYQSYVNTQIQALDSTKTGAANGVSVTVTQVDGKIDSVSVVAPSLSHAIEALDVDPFYLTELNGTTLQRYQISEADGKIVKGQTPETLLTFASAPTAENKVVTLTEINALNANVTSEETTNVKVQVVESAGKITEVHVTDNSVNATDVNNAITNAINGLDSTKSNVEALTNGTTTTDIRVEVVEADGMLTAVNVTDTLAKVAHTGKATDVGITNTDNMFGEASSVQSALEVLAGEIDTINGQTISAEANQAVKVTTDDNGNTTIGLQLNEAENKAILSQTADGLKTTLEVVTKQYPSEPDAEGYVAEKAGKTYIQITGVDNNVISETDAAAFVKDGMLSTATVVKGTWTGESFTESTDGQDKAIKLVWNTDAGKEAMYINAETLVDSYTAGNGWIEIDQATNKISHKEQSGLPTEAQGIEEAVTGTGAYAETKTFKVPQLTVDAAGHVTAVNEKVVSITLPAKQIASEVAITAITGIEATDVQGALAELQGDINAINAVAWTGDAEINVDNDTHKITHTAHTVTPTTSTNEDAVKAVVIPQLTVNAAGHVTGIDNKTFNIDCNVTTVSGKEGQILVNPTESGEDVNYEVSLATVSQNNTTAEHKFNDAEANTTKVISGVTVDSYGRVIGIQTMTIFEDYDCGTYGETNN